MYNGTVSGTHMGVAADCCLPRLKVYSKGGNNAWYRKSSQLSETSEIMVLRKESTTATWYRSIIPYYITNLTLIPTGKCGLQLQPLIKDVSLYCKWRPPQKTLTGHNEERNASLGAEPQWICLYHSSCIYGSGNIVKEGSEIPGSQLWNSVLCKWLPKQDCNINLNRQINTEGRAFVRSQLRRLR